MGGENKLLAVGSTGRWLMRSVHRFALFALTVGFLHPVTAQPRKSDLEQVLQLFPGYHLLKPEEFDEDTRAFLRSHFPKDNPSVISSDFDGNGVLDYAFLLKGEKSSSTKVEVVLCAPNKQCRSVYHLDVSSYAGAVYLRPARIGSHTTRTDAVPATEGTSKGRLSLAGIQVLYFEKGKVLLSWNPKHRRIEEVQTGD